MKKQKIIKQLKSLRVKCEAMEQSINELCDWLVANEANMKLLSEELLNVKDHYEQNQRIMMQESRNYMEMKEKLSQRIQKLEDETRIPIFTGGEKFPELKHTISDFEKRNNYSYHHILKQLHTYSKDKELVHDVKKILGKWRFSDFIWDLLEQDYLKGYQNEN